MELPSKAYFSNFLTFDRKTSRALLLFMQITSVRDITISVGLFQLEYSLRMFATVRHRFISDHFRDLSYLPFQIMRTSYSYIALFRSVS